ncbi:MAG: hypothetical protein AAGB34_04890 [Planctomycetota bacterium]
MIRVQIIDDDYWCAEAIKAMMMDVSAEFDFEYSAMPEQINGCDIYIVDNEFGTGDYAEQLVQQVRSANPEAMIMVCSGTMSRVRYKQLINAGCDVAIEKGSAVDRDVMMVAIARYVLASRSRKRRVGFWRALDDIRTVLNTWNKRFEIAESRSA